jgi:hypothetical protein
MKRDDIMEKNEVQYSENLPGYEKLITDLISEHKSVYDGFREKSSEFKKIIFEDFRSIMTPKGYKVDNIYNKLSAVNPKGSIELYERNEKIYLNFKSETSSVQVKEDGKVDFKNNTVSKLFILYVGSDLEAKIFDFGGWSCNDKLTCHNKEHDYTVEYYKKEYLRLKEILDEQKRLLMEINMSTFFINLRMFFNEGALVFSSGHEKQIGIYSSMKEVLEKAFQLV